VSAVEGLYDDWSHVKADRDEYENLLKELCGILSVYKVEGVRNEVARIQHELLDLKQVMRNEREKLKQQKHLSRQMTSLFRENEKSAEEAIESQNQRIAGLEDQRKGLLKEIRNLRNEISRLKSEIDKIHHSSDEQLKDLKDEQQTILQRLKSEFAQNRAQLTADLESKTRQLDEHASTIRRLEAEAQEHKQQLYAAKSSEKAKTKEVQALWEQADGANSQWHQRIDREKEQIQAQYESLLATLKTKNRELRELCSKTNESISRTEAQNQELVRRCTFLERENEQLRRGIESDKDEVMREKLLIETKARAAEMRNEVKSQAEIEALKAEFEKERQKLFAFLVKKFTQFFDGRQNWTTEGIKAVVVQASSELERMKQSDAAIRRLLCITADESAEDAITELLLSLNRH
jgi:chromosome segregation ATPase